MKAKHAEYFLGRMLAVERTIAGLMAKTIDLKAGD
jgi:hypothetical protein